MPRWIERGEQTAAVLGGAGAVRLERREIPRPRGGEALVRVGSVGICGSDIAYVRGTSRYAVRAPFVMGHEASGVVVALGDPIDAAAPGPGTRVALIPGVSCGRCGLCRGGRDNLCAEVRYLGSAAVYPHVDGALQQYVVLPVANLLPLPADVSLSTAALLEPLAVATHAVRRTEVADRSVLVTGGGAIGQLVALVANRLGAGEVHVCETIPRRREIAVQHGADRAWDPAEAASAIADGARFDVVIEASGHPQAVDLALASASPGTGHVVLVGNLPAGHRLDAHAITRAESWVTATLRFPGGLAPALELLTSTGLDIDWLVEARVGLADVAAAFAAAQRADPPLKVQIDFRSYDQNEF